MQSSHTLVTDIAFDDSTLIAAAGIVPMLGLASMCELEELADEWVQIPTDKGAHAGAKVLAVLTGMMMNGDSIDDMAVLRHGAMRRIVDRPYAPSTLGSFLRMFTWGNARQLDAVSSRLTARLVGQTPVLDDIDGPCFLDFDDTITPLYGYAKQGVGYGYSGIKGLNALIGTVSGLRSAPMVCGQRLRSGSTYSSRGVHQFVTEMVNSIAAMRGGRTDGILARGDSAFYTHNTVSAAVDAGVEVSVTMKMDTKVVATIEAIAEDAWTPITYRHPVKDPETGAWITHAAIAEVPYTAFTGNAHTVSEHIAGRMIVRRMPKYTDTDQPGMFDEWRYRPIFTTDTDTDPVTVDKTHCHHAIIEKVHADLKGSALRHLPSGQFAANAAWLTCAVMAFNLTRAAGALTRSPRMALASTATIRATLINIPARITYSARRYTAHLPTNWPWRTEWLTLYKAVTHPKHAL